jgi:hypothetical protein
MIISTMTVGLAKHPSVALNLWSSIQSVTAACEEEEAESGLIIERGVYVAVACMWSMFNLSMRIYTTQAGIGRLGGRRA